MSNTARWIVAILLILFGIAFAAFAIFGGASSTVGCVKSPPDWIYYLLIVAGVVTLAAAVAPAIMLIRKARAMRIAVVLVLGIVVSCVGYGLYLYLLGQYC